MTFILKILIKLLLISKLSMIVLLFRMLKKNYFLLLKVMFWKQLLDIRVIYNFMIQKQSKK